MSETSIPLPRTFQQSPLPAAADARRTSIWTWAGALVVMAVVALELFARESEAVKTLTITFISIVLEAFPFIMIGALVGGVIEVFVSREWVTRMLPKRPLFACMAAGCLGLALPVCECAVVPVTRRLVRKGVPFSAAMTYLLAGPIFNPLVAASTIVAYGWNWRVLAVRMICGYAIGVGVGYLMGRFYQGHSALVGDWATAGADGGHHHAQHVRVFAHASSGGTGNGNGVLAGAGTGVAGTQSAPFVHVSAVSLLRPVSAIDEDACGCGHDHEIAVGADGGSPALGRKFLAVLEHAGEDFLYVGQFLIIGALVAAASQTFISRQFFVTLASTPIAAIVMMMVLAVFLNLCSEADAFVASSFRSVLPLSAQMAFMVLGPMLDFKLTAMYLGFLRKRAFITMVVIMSTLVLIAMLVFHGSSWEVLP